MSQFKKYHIKPHNWSKKDMLIYNLTGEVFENHKFTEDNFNKFRDLVIEIAESVDFIQDNDDKIAFEAAFDGIFHDLDENRYCKELDLFYNDEYRYHSSLSNWERNR